MDFSVIPQNNARKILRHLLRQDFPRLPLDGRKLKSAATPNDEIDKRVTQIADAVEKNNFRVFVE